MMLVSRAIRLTRMEGRRLVSSAESTRLGYAS